MKRLLLFGLLLGCGGEDRTVARPIDQRDQLAPVDPIVSLRLRCRSNAVACVELAKHPVIASERQASCDRGDPDACLDLGLAYSDGYDVAQIRTRGLQLLERACSMNHLVACGIAGSAHVNGNGIPVDVPAAIRLYTRGCDGGEPGGCVLLGRIYGNGEGVPEDRRAAARLFARACELKLGAGCRDQAILLGDARKPDRAKICSLFDAGCKGNDDKACELLASECEASHPQAYENYTDYSTSASLCGPGNAEYCRNAGKLREGAPGVAASPEEAAELYVKGCQADDRDSCLEQARLYASHPQLGDPRQALDEACARAVPGVCLAAGRGDLTGEPGRRQPARAIERFERACAQAEAEGCLELARGRRDRIAGAVDRAIIVETFRKACAAGSLAACREGKLVEPSAQTWFDTQACFHGDVAACGGQRAGLAIATRTIALNWPLSPGGFVQSSLSLRFVGPDEHGLLASGQDQLALLDPMGRVAASWISLASAKKPGPRPEAQALGRAISRSLWCWNEIGDELNGLVTIGGYGLAVDYGVAVWAPMSQALPAVFPPLDEDRILTWQRALSADCRLALVSKEYGHSGTRLLDLRTRRPIGGLIGGEHPGPAGAMAFSADGSQVALAFRGGPISIVATDTGTASTLGTSMATIESMSFHPTRRVLVSSDSRERVRIWQLDTPGRGSILLAEPAHTAAFSPDGRHLALVRDEELVLLDATTLQRVARPVPFDRIEGRSAIVFSPDSRYAVIWGRPTPSNGDLVVIFDLDPGATTRPIDSAWFAKLRPLPVPAPPPAPRFDRDAAITGTVSVNGKPVAGAQIELRPSLDEWPDARALPPRFTRSTDDGRYAFPRLPAIEWRMTVTSPDTQIARTTVNLRKGEGYRQSPVVLELKPGVAVRGKVLDESGKAASGVLISVAGRFRRDVATDRKGRFEVRHLEPHSRFELRARRADGAVATIPVDLATSVTLPELVLRLLSPSDPRILRLKVVDPSGKPIASAFVSTRLGIGVTDASGTLILDGSGDEKETYVSVHSEKRLLASRQISLPQPGVVTVMTDPPLLK